MYIVVDPTIPLITFISSLAVSTGREILQTVAEPEVTPPLPAEILTAANDAITVASADLATASQNVNTATQTTAALTSVIDALTSLASSLGPAPRSVTTCEDFSNKLKSVLNQLSSEPLTQTGLLLDDTVAEAQGMVSVISNIMIPCSPDEALMLIEEIGQQGIQVLGALGAFIEHNEDQIDIAIKEIAMQMFLADGLGELTNVTCGNCVFPFIYQVSSYISYKSDMFFILQNLITI